MDRNTLAHELDAVREDVVGHILTAKPSVDVLLLEKVDARAKKLVALYRGRYVDQYKQRFVGRAFTGQDDGLHSAYIAYLYCIEGIYAIDEDSFEHAWNSLKLAQLWIDSYLEERSLTKQRRRKTAAAGGRAKSKKYDGVKAELIKQLSAGRWKSLDQAVRVIAQPIFDTLPDPHPLRDEEKDYETSLRRLIEGSPEVRAAFEKHKAP